MICYRNVYFVVRPNNPKKREVKSSELFRVVQKDQTNQNKQKPTKKPNRLKMETTLAFLQQNLPQYHRHFFHPM